RTDSGTVVVFTGSNPEKIWYHGCAAGADDMDMIKLSVPGSLLFRDVVLRVTASACRLMRSMAVAKQEASREEHDFDDRVVSAMGEAFNNVAIHAYRGGGGRVEIEFEISALSITIRLIDFGAAFDLTEARPLVMSELPESGMGLFIVRECMDEVSYRRGNPPEMPNVLTLTKRVEKN
ncbi:MAG TPA: ATP-binding protein, partial [Polyangiaceae bacterium]|nr:ATP-binding protein [Polyangiaceae bacterium]